MDASAWLAPALWLLVGFAVGFALAVLLLRTKRSRTPSASSFDLPLTLDLLCRAHAGRAGWAIGLAAGPVEARSDHQQSEFRGAVFAQLASVDGRVHVAREAEGTYVATGDFPYGAALLLEAREAGQAATDAVVVDLRRLVENMRLAEIQASAAPGQLVARQLALGVAGAQTLDGVARAGAELAQQITQRGAAVVMRGKGREQETAQVIAVSSAADKRLIGRWLEPDAPICRALQAAVPIVTRGTDDVFGPGMPERRRHERAGSAFPLLDGRTAVGALVLIGTSAADTASSTTDRISALVAELGPRLGAAKAVQDAEQRAVQDPLTGLRNRGEFQRTLESYRAQKLPPPATLVYVDLDHFKRLNDTLGHAAGDAALKHVAHVLEQAVRDGDLVARIGGEEFAVWLPRALAREGLEVAERIRDSIADTSWLWSGTPYPLTTSCGVATYPDPIADLRNLPAAADAALYRAKQAGRNRVEKASSGN
jgi:diguanylate cyclase (GGDEF)-like protein